MQNSTYLNDYGIPNGPIEKKVPAYIEKERYFINFFEKKGMVEELESRTNLAVSQLEMLKDEILLHIEEGLTSTKMSVYKKLYQECIKFSEEINNIAHNNEIDLNEDLNGEIDLFYGSIDESLGLDKPYEKKLSKEALKFKSDVENESHFKTDVQLSVRQYALLLKIEIESKARPPIREVIKFFESFGKEVGRSPKSLQIKYNEIKIGETLIGFRKADVDKVVEYLEIEDSNNETLKEARRIQKMLPID